MQLKRNWFDDKATAVTNTMKTLKVSPKTDSKDCFGKWKHRCGRSIKWGLWWMPSVRCRKNEADLILLKQTSYNARLHEKSSFGTNHFVAILFTPHFYTTRNIILSNQVTAIVLLRVIWSFCFSLLHILRLQKALLQFQESVVNRWHLWHEELHFGKLDRFYHDQFASNFLYIINLILMDVLQRIRKKGRNSQGTRWEIISGYWEIAWVFFYIVKLMENWKYVVVNILISSLHFKIERLLW